jgi:hypothetical protein
MKKFILPFIFFCTFSLFSQNKLGSYLYKGTLDSKILVTLYFKVIENPCGGSYQYQAMYKYDGLRKWMLLDVSPSLDEKKYCMVEPNFTGVLFLYPKGKEFIGKWLDPNGEKTLKMVLKKTKTTPKLTKELEEQLEKVIHNNNDC